MALRWPATSMVEALSFYRGPRELTPRQRALVDPCQICHESLSGFSGYYQYSPCSHTICPVCWEQYSNKNTCPSCMTTRAYQRIGHFPDQDEQRRRRRILLSPIQTQNDGSGISAISAISALSVDLLARLLAVRVAFAMLDRDHDGFITVGDIMELIGTTSFTAEST